MGQASLNKVLYTYIHTVEQRTFLAKNFFETGSLEVTRERFAERFPEWRPPALKTIWANVRKYFAHDTTLNRNKGNSGRNRTGRSQANIEAVRVRLAEHPTGTSARRNGVGLPSATFNWVVIPRETRTSFCPWLRHWR